MARTTSTARPSAPAGPGVDQTDRLLWALHQLAVAGAAFDVRVARVLGLSPTDYLALKHLMAAPAPLGPADLARRLGMSTGSVNALVDRLEARGHLLRRPHDSDRRRIELELTPSSREAVLREIDRHVGPIRASVADVDPTELARLADLLTLVAAGYGPGPGTVAGGGRAQADAAAELS